MKTLSAGNAWRGAILVLLCAWTNLLWVPAAVGASKTPPTSHAAAPAEETKPSDPWPPELPQSVFVIPSSPKDGRNPFFPRSTFGADTVVTPKPGHVEFSSFVLNGITSPPKRTAMINGRTFEVGEEGEVRLQGGGKEFIKCEEIRADSAVILVHGQRLELRFRSGF